MKRAKIFSAIAFALALSAIDVFINPAIGAGFSTRALSSDLRAHQPDDKCIYCKGTGLCEFCDRGKRDCATCEGEGVIRRTDKNGNEQTKPCKKCDGKGMVRCKKCAGKGHCRYCGGLGYWGGGHGH